MSSIQCRKRALKIIVQVGFVSLTWHAGRRKEQRHIRGKVVVGRAFNFIASTKALAFSGEGKANKKLEIGTSY